MRNWIWQLRVKLLQSGLTVCSLMDYSLPGSSVHGILHARVLEWVAMPSSRGSSPPGINMSFSSPAFHPYQVGSVARVPSGKTHVHACCCCCQVASVVSDSLRPQGLQPTRLLRPWDFPGKSNIRVQFLSIYYRRINAIVHNSFQFSSVQSLSHV